ncbi:unnamed protein product [Echinostoma caproni]|uniref:RING-type domain-containing protein n=1 Tax=Echinostoma caproni TaxID=27848 RepID=A0A183B9F0_9TREM|nr:unnamed protein product [Echinostoma caproni]
MCFQPKFLCSDCTKLTTNELVWLHMQPSEKIEHNFGFGFRYDYSCIVLVHLFLSSLFFAFPVSNYSSVSFSLRTPAYPRRTGPAPIDPDHWSTASAAAAPTNEDTKECCICMINPINCAFVQCGHMATCYGCGQGMEKCPICRQSVQFVMRVYPV